MHVSFLMQIFNQIKTACTAFFSCTPIWITIFSDPAAILTTWWPTSSRMSASVTSGNTRPRRGLLIKPPRKKSSAWNSFVFDVPVLWSLCVSRTQPIVLSLLHCLPFSAYFHLSRNHNIQQKLQHSTRIVFRFCHFEVQFACNQQQPLIIIYYLCLFEQSNTCHWNVIVKHWRLLYTTEFGEKN